MTLAYRVCTNQKEKSVKGVGSDGRGSCVDKLPLFLIFALPWLNPDLAAASLHWEDELETLLKLNFLTSPSPSPHSRKGIHTVTNL